MSKNPYNPITAPISWKWFNERPENLANIKPIKNSWDREEVIELLHKVSLNQSGNGQNAFWFNDEKWDKWIKENL